MADSFGIPQLVDYLTTMGLRLTSIDYQREIIEIAFHGNQGQWRMIVALQQGGNVRKLVLVTPHLYTVTTKRRLECLEALMAVNYRITIGKFGLDLNDGEIRLEEAMPIDEHGLSLAQFQSLFTTLMQTVTIYQSLIPRILYGNLTAREALEACEREFMEENGGAQQADASFTTIEDEIPPIGELALDLDANDVLAEITRMLEEPKDQG